MVPIIATDNDITRLKALTRLAAAAVAADRLDVLHREAIAALTAGLNVARAALFQPSTAADVFVAHGGGQLPCDARITVSEAMLSGPMPIRSVPTDVGLMDGFTFPIGFTDEAMGVMAVLSSPPGARMDDVSVGYAEEVASVVAAAIRRQRITEELHSSKQRLMMAQSIAHMGSYDWTIATDRNVWSDELYRIYGTEPQSFNASYERFLSFIHPDDREKIMAIHRKAIETGGSYEMEERIIRPDGEERILESNGQVILDSEGKPARMVGICFDVTDQRRAKAEVQKYREIAAAHERAKEINDNIVQGLTIALLSVDVGDVEAGTAALKETLVAARGMMNDLLEVGGGETVLPGDLVRTTPAMTVNARRGTIRIVPKTDAISVVLADDSEDVRLLLSMALNTDPRVCVAAEARDGFEAVDAAKRLQPDVMLLDLSMPRMDGLEAIPLIRAASPNTKIVVLSGFDAAQMSTMALEVGAHRYLEKGLSPKELVAAVCSIYEPA